MDRALVLVSEWFHESELAKLMPDYKQLRNLKMRHLNTTHFIIPYHRKELHTVKMMME